MVLLPLLLALALPAALAVVPQKQPPKYFTQKLDHFNAEAGSWTQRYYVDSSAWSGAAELGPVLFIPGGEWSVTPEKGLLYGMVRELAVELGGIAMIAEHRFYGGSIPFNGSVEEAFQPVPSRIGLLSVAQAMADYAALINTVRDEHGCPDCPVISFGGSYSGKLSAYLRLKYPTVVDMALAASAPIKLDSVGLVDPLKYYRIVTDAAEKIQPGCTVAVRKAFVALRSASPSEAQQALGLCQQPTASEYGWNDLEFWITQYFATMAMFNYPPSASPLQRDCSLVIGNATTSHAPLSGFKRLLEPHYNATKGCFDIAAQAPADVPASASGKGTVSCSDWSGCGPGLGGLSWDYQACSQVLQPLGTSNKSDMFPPHDWTETWMTEHCRRRFGLAAPGFTWMKEQMGIDAIERWPQPTRVIFSNGLQDPWSAGGVVKNITSNPTIVAITIENGAHHQDLNGGHSPTDTPDMLAARAQEKATLGRWLKEVQAERRSKREAAI